MSITTASATGSLSSEAPDYGRGLFASLQFWRSYCTSYITMGGCVHEELRMKG